MSHVAIADSGLRQRKRLATHQRIADEAARLVKEKGVAHTTIDDIAAAAEIGRATFFRYFDAKEVAIIEGFSVPWIPLIIDQLRTQPPELTAMEAVYETFTGFAPVLDDGGLEMVLQQARLSASSPGLQAWTLHAFVRFERAIAEAVSPRFPDLQPDDPRPLLVGALTMTAVRLSLDTWLASDGSKDLPALLSAGLRAVQIR